MTKPPFRVGFIGAGGIAHAHALHLRKIEAVELVAAADINPAALAKLKEQQAVARTYADVAEMLAKETELDAVCVCTPNSLHAEHAIAALEAGRHVLVEKPMAINATQAKAMLDTATKAGRHLVVGFQYRFDPKTQVIRRQIDDGEFGKVLFVRCQALRRRGIPSWGVFGRREHVGGGPLIDIGVHVLETAHYLMGAPRPVAATGSTYTYVGNKPAQALGTWANWDWKTHSVEDLALGQIRFDNGAMLAVEASYAAHIEKDVWNLQVMGEKGGAVWDPVQIFKDQNGYMFTSTPHFAGKWDIFESKMRHFVEVCRDGRPNQAPPEHGLMVQQMIDALYQSAETQREVRIGESTGTAKG